MRRLLAILGMVCGVPVLANADERGTFVLPFQFDEEIPGHVVTVGVQGVF